ncbi:MAG: hypothetical protein ABI056_05815 [Caulobacteraceae bacterium]
MLAAAGWQLIDGELAAWRREGRRPLFWWRDDDVRAPSASLRRLLELSERNHVPIALAIIPDVDLTPLGEALLDRPQVTAIQHGCDHVDRNHGGGFSAEFAPTQPAEDVAATITAAWRRLCSAVDAVPVYAPPWNRLTANVAAALATTPLRAVSVYGANVAPAGAMPRINTHIDVMKWRPPRFRGAPFLLLRLWRQLRVRRRTARWEEPIGWLTHHRNLDEDAWVFMEILLRRLGPTRGIVTWRSIGELADFSSP